MSCSKNCKCRPGVVAFIFVPGIMGSRLQNKLTKNLIWDPAAGLLYKGLSSEGQENINRLEEELRKTAGIQDFNCFTSADAIRQHIAEQMQKESMKEIGRDIERYIASISTIRDLVLAGPEERKRMLVNANLEVNGEERDDDLLEVASGDDNYFKIFTSVLPSQIDLKKQRGWGEVLWDSYGPFLVYLEKQVEELKELYPGMSFPVFAVGYNWMLSNEVAGERIKKKLIEFKAQILKDERQNMSEEDIKFIIISHSMGGIASRSALMLSDLTSEVEGVIHCAMPTYGSPDTYKRMRCGQDGISKLAVGINAAEITAILAFSQGGLELLPNQLYKTADNNNEWLFYATSKKKIPMPIKYGDEIYEFYKQCDLWYSLIQSVLLAPELTWHGAILDSVLLAMQQPELAKYINAYKKRIEAVKLFHQRLANGFHPTTTLIYSDNPKHKSYDYCCWRGRTSPDGNINQWKIFGNQNHNIIYLDDSILLKGPPTIFSWIFEDPILNPSIIRFTIDSAKAKGDGTVHIGSGEYAIAAGGLKKISLPATEDHQGILNCPKVREKVISEIKTWLEDIHHKMGG